MDAHKSLALIETAMLAHTCNFFWLEQVASRNQAGGKKMTAVA